MQGEGEGRALESECDSPAEADRCATATFSSRLPPRFFFLLFFFFFTARLAALFFFFTARIDMTIASMTEATAAAIATAGGTSGIDHEIDHGHRIDHGNRMSRCW